MIIAHCVYEEEEEEKEEEEEEDKKIDNQYFKIYLILPCLKTPASRSCLPNSTASSLVFTSPLVISQSTNSLATMHCLNEVR